MKRIIPAFILIFALLFCLPACQGDNSNQKVFDLLNGYAAVSLDSYAIRMTVTSPNGYQTNTLYTVTTESGERSVSYRTEELGGFNLDGELTAPDSYVTVSEGTLPALQSSYIAYDLPTFQFSSKTLKNFAVEKTSYPYVFTAELISAEKFMGRELDGTNVAVSGVYVAGGLSQVSLSYETENGNTVTLTYLYN